MASANVVVLSSSSILCGRSESVCCGLGIADGDSDDRMDGWGSDKTIHHSVM